MSQENLRDQRRHQLHAAYFAQAETAESRRRTPRVRVEIPLTLHLDEWETDTQTLDLSEGGYSFLASAPPTQEFLPFALELEPQRVVRGHGRVVAHTPAGSWFRVCVSFAKLDAQAHEAISEHILNEIEQTLPLS